jgi:hypothetical protein
MSVGPRSEGLLERCSREYCCGTRTSEEFIVVPQFREPGVCPLFCPYFCPSQSRNLSKEGGAGGRLSSARRMAPAALQSGVSWSGADVRRACPLRTIRGLHRIGDPLTHLSSAKCATTMRGWHAETVASGECPDPPTITVPPYTTPVSTSGHAEDDFHTGMRLLGFPPKYRSRLFSGS